MNKMKQAMLIYALEKDWQAVIGLNAEQLISTAVSFYLAGSRDNETKVKIDDIYESLK